MKASSLNDLLHCRPLHCQPPGCWNKITQRYDDMSEPPEEPMSSYRTPHPDEFVHPKEPREETEKSLKSTERGDGGDDYVLIFENLFVSIDTQLSLQSTLEDGCYLVYDNSSGGRLLLHYSRTRPVQENIVGFWTPGLDHHIPEYHYQGGGRIELIRGIIGGPKDHRRYLQGWCQFLQLAKQAKGWVKKYQHPKQALNVDIYGYFDGQVRHLDIEERFFRAQHLQSVAVVGHDNDRFVGVHTLNELLFLAWGEIEGASIKMHHELHSMHLTEI